MAPKGESDKPKNAYHLWMADNSDAIAKKYSSLSGKDLLKKKQEEWKNLDKAKRDVYEKRAKELKAEYEKTKKDESAGESDEETTTSKKRKGGKDSKKPAKKAKKDPNAPKRPLTAYFLFGQDNREEIKNELMKTATPEEQKKIVTLVAKKLGERWKALTAEEKKPYEDKAKAAKAAYEKDKAAYDEGGKTKASSSKKKEESEEEESEEESEEEDDE